MIQRYFVIFGKAKIVLIASLLTMFQSALALEINNNAGATLTAKIKDCLPNKLTTKIPPNQTYGCVAGEECSGTCRYSIDAPKSKKCKGEIDAGRGLQVNAGLQCVPY